MITTTTTEASETETQTLSLSSTLDRVHYYLENGSHFVNAVDALLRAHGGRDGRKEGFVVGTANLFITKEIL
jgi:hypothetical protein